MRKLGAALSMAVVLALVPATSNAGTGACETVVVRSWNVKVHVQKKTYRIGDKAKVTIDVTRKKTGTPVADAKTATAVTNKNDDIVFGWGVTNAAGRATVKVPLTRGHVRTGSATLHAYSYQTTVDSYCASVGEYGYEKVRKAFRIER